MNRNIKTTNGLMMHIRRSHGISISGTKEKRRLLNYGYFHGFKGYKQANGRQLPFASFSQICDTISFDSCLKSLLYEKMMFIETALKSVVTQCILDASQSSSINDMLNNVVENYRNSSALSNRTQAQKNFLKLKSSIDRNISNEYQADNSIITHYYENSTNHNDVPIWALMEILMLGDFGFLVSSLTFNVRDSISKEFDINRSYDSDRICFFKMIYILKDLRNAIAHNGVVYDTRFKKADINNTVRQCLIQEFRLPHVNFKDIIDYVALISFFLKHLKVTKSEIKRFINQIEKNVNGFLNKVGLPIAGPSFPNGWRQRLRLIINNL